MFELKQIAKLVVERAKKDKDVTIAVTGFEGDGKTALSIGLGLAIDPLFDIRRNVLFSPTVAEIKEKIFTLPPFSCIIADEAIKIMYKLNWGQKIQKYLNTIYAVCRKENKISIFNIPRFNDLSEYFRNHRIKLWIHIVDPISNVKKEGRAVIMAKSWNPVLKDIWGLESFERAMKEERRRRRKDSDYSMEDKINMFRTMPTFLGVIAFDWVSDEIWADYNAIKSEVAVEDDELMVQDKFAVEKERWEKRTLIAVKTFIQMGYAKKKIAELFHVKPMSITAWLKKEEREKEKLEVNEPTS